MWRTEHARRRPLHDGHDVADRELRRRRRQQGPGVREVHRPAVPHAAAASSWRSTARSDSCASTAGRPSTRWASRARCGTIATSSSGRRRSSASPSTPTWRHARAGSATAPSATWPAGRPGARAGHGLERAPAVGRRAARHSRTPDEALAGLDAHRRATTRAHARARRRDRRASTSTPPACCRRSSSGLRVSQPAAHRARGARRARRCRRRRRVRSSR